MKTYLGLSVIFVLVSYHCTAQYTQLFQYWPSNPPWPPLFYEDPISVADFDGDGIKDILSEFVRISYSGAGPEYFNVTEFTNFDGFGTRAIAVGDFNGDGFKDIARNSLYDSSTGTYLHMNNGSGNILSITPVSTTIDGVPTYTSGVNEVIAADIDEDGAVDILRTTGFGLDDEYYSNAIEILHNQNNSGVWELKNGVIYPYYSVEILAITLGDINGDGRKDILYRMRINDFGTPSNLMWLENMSTPGNIQFQPAQFIKTQFIPLDIADINGDGFTDIIGINEANNRYAWLPNLGNNTFGEPITIADSINGAAVSASPFMNAVAKDMNNDGFTDVVLCASNFGYKVFILLNDGTGVFTLDEVIPIGVRDLLVEDVTGDGILEIIIGTSSGVLVYALESTCTPIAPTNLLITYVAGGVQLSWTPFEGASRCRIQAGSNINGPFQYINVTGSDISQTFIPAEALIVGNLYGWRVRCFCPGDPEIPGPWSANIFTGIYSPPDASNVQFDEFNVAIYPNPSRGEVRIKASSSDFTLQVFDLAGRKLHEYYSPGLEFRIEPGELNPGLYVLRFIRKGENSSKLLSVQR